MADTPEELKKLRDAFEAKVNETAHDLPLARYYGGIEAYRDSRTNNCWEFWQAAYALGLSDMQERAAWVSVEDGLPPEGTDWEYLTYHGDSGDIFVTTWIHTEFSLEDFIVKCSGPVTHWRPLPKPPAAIRALPKEG